MYVDLKHALGHTDAPLTPQRCTAVTPPQDLPPSPPLPLEALDHVLAVSRDDSAGDLGLRHRQDDDDDDAGSSSTAPTGTAPESKRASTVAASSYGVVDPDLLVDDYGFVYKKGVDKEKMARYGVRRNVLCL